ncbi:MAG: hypothetical protein EBS59_07170 [Verrucomicrobia bacterium]|nr:hypothetical protein [Verrucomicrobiota bacterium]
MTDQFLSSDKIKKRGPTLIRIRHAFLGRRTRKREPQIWNIPGSKEILLAPGWGVFFFDKD